MKMKGGKDRSSGQSDAIVCLPTLGVVILISSVHVVCWLFYLIFLFLHLCFLFIACVRL